jgi:hypothetical protein
VRRERNKRAAAAARKSKKKGRKQRQSRHMMDEPVPWLSSFPQDSTHKKKRKTLFLSFSLFFSFMIIDLTLNFWQTKWHAPLFFFFLFFVCA